jgi:hypothetical protein
MERFMKHPIITATALLCLLSLPIQFAHAGRLNLQETIQGLKSMREVDFTQISNGSRDLVTPYLEIDLRRTITSREIRFGQNITASREIRLNFISRSARDGKYVLMMDAELAGEHVAEAFPEIQRISNIIKKALLKNQAITPEQSFIAAEFGQWKNSTAQQITVAVKSPEQLQALIREVDQAVREANIQMEARLNSFLSE